MFFPWIRQHWVLASIGLTLPPTVLLWFATPGGLPLPVLWAVAVLTALLVRVFVIDRRRLPWPPRRYPRE